MLLTELTAAAKQYLADKGYTESTIYHNYAWHWNSFSKTLEGNAEYNLDILTEYVIQCYGKNLLEMAPAELTHREYIRHVAFCALDDFSRTGRISGTSMSGSQVRQPLSKESGAALHSFLMHLDELDYKPKTRRYHQHTVHAFLFRCPLESMDPEAVLRYIQQLGIKAKATMKSEQKVIKRFLSFLWEKGLTSQDHSCLIISVKRRKNTEIPSVYSPREIMSLLHYIKDNGKNRLRNYAIISLIAVYGYRACDIVKMELSDIDWDNAKIQFAQDKTDVWLEHRLTEFCGKALADYLLLERPSTDARQVFVKENGEKLSSTSVSSMIFYAFLHSGVYVNGRKHGSHSLRHSLASNMLEQGSSILDVSRVLGHASVESTLQYTKIDIRHLRMCELEVPDYGE